MKPFLLEKSDESERSCFLDVWYWSWLLDRRFQGCRHWIGCMSWNKRSCRSYESPLMDEQYDPSPTSDEELEQAYQEKYG